ncbi:MAG: alpha/beta hydrolase [Gordonia sp.]|nr:alpha/beta hydrolase [Gordonia sp. (in: high G+C Gram-positive bacteria)]
MSPASERPMPDSLNPGLLTDQLVVGEATVHWGMVGAGSRTVVLVHGHQAHHMWWHAVVRHLQNSWRVILFDLSGHGLSDHRENYAAGVQWAHDLLAVLDVSGADRPVVIGHSMGGRIAVSATADRPDLVRGIILIDSMVRVVPRHNAAPAWHPDRRPRVRSNRDEAVARFRLKPDQPNPAPEILRPVAQYSVGPIADGWGWRYDQRGIPGVNDAAVTSAMANSQVPLRLVHAEDSRVLGADAVTEVERLKPPGGLRVIRLPGCHHHVVLDEPERIAGLIDELAGAIYLCDEGPGPVGAHHDLRSTINKGAHNGR